MYYCNNSDNDSNKRHDRYRDRNKNRNRSYDKNYDKNYKKHKSDKNDNLVKPFNIIGPLLSNNNQIEPVSEEDFYNEDDYDEIIYRDIKTIDDLIELGKLYDSNKRKKYNINVKKLYGLIEPLQQLKNMIGMHNVKNHIIDIIIYYLQDFEKYNKNIMHTVLYGPPGSGKTELATILAKIYCKMGLIKTDKINAVKRSDLIGEFLGHSAKKTQKEIDNAKDGILLIDEAYSLGNNELRDSFSKECIDTINQNLTENKINFICIIAVYINAL